MSERILEVCPSVVHGDMREVITLEADEARMVLDELAGAPVDRGAAKLRALSREHYWLRVVTIDNDGQRDAGPLLPIDGLIRLAEYPDPDRDALADAFDDDAREAGDRAHEQAHGPGRV